MSLRPTSVTKSGIIHLPITGDNAPKIIIKVTDDSGVEHIVCDTVTGASANNWLLSCKLERVLTDKLSSFSITLSNLDGKWFNSFNGGELVKIYGDYVDGTTLLFRGKTDNAKYGVNASNGFFVKLVGRDYPEIIDKTITNQYVAALASEAIGDVLYNDFSDITLTFWNGSVWSEATYNYGSETVTWSDAVPDFPTTRINLQFQHKKGWSIIKEICKRAGLSAYLWYDESSSKWTLRTFIEGDITNTSVSIGYGVNLINMGDYGYENTAVFNRVFVYGKKESDNIISLSTKESASSQADLWIKDLVVNRPELSTNDEVSDAANFELNNNSVRKNTGRFTIVGTPNLQIGEQIAASVPYTGCDGLHTATRITHNIGNTFLTTVEVSKNLDTIPDILKAKADPDDFSQGTTNLNSMTTGYTYFFEGDDDDLTHTNTEVKNGKLQLQDGKVTGNTVSATLVLDTPVRYCEFRRYENYNTKDDVYYVTNDGGATWESIDTTSGIVHRFATAGNLLAWKISMQRYSSTSTSPAYESVSLLSKP